MDDARRTLAEIAQSMPAPGHELSAQGVVEIVSKDLDAMLSFYGALGFRIERRTGPFAVVNGFGVRLFLAENSAAPDFEGWGNLRIVVPDVDRVWDCVRTLELPVTHAIADRPYGLRDFVLEDPIGFEIRFAQVL